VGVRILILGGTGEARELAAQLVAAGVDVLSSLAGRVREPRLPDGPVPSRSKAARCSAVTGTACVVFILGSGSPTG
jgi:precorrin-6x reductase